MPNALCNKIVKRTILSSRCFVVFEAISMSTMAFRTTMTILLIMMVAAAAGAGESPDVEQCGVYMAPSTLGESTNMGIYAGIDYARGQKINFPEIVIPLLFREWGEHVDFTDDGSLWERYIWDGAVANIESYTETNREDTRAVFVPGVGCTINGVMSMKNIKSTHDSEYDVAGLHRAKDPGAGAFTPYHRTKSTAVVNIPAGSEIFADYGEEWVPFLPGAQITTSEVMDKADDFLEDEVLPFMKEHDEMTDDLKEGLWQYMKDFPFYSQSFTMFPRSKSWKDVEQVSEELAKEKEEHIEQIIDAYDDYQHDNQEPPKKSIVARFHRRIHVRSLDWLATHPNSYCQDHLKPARSTIKQAGLGAFASRDLKAGQVIGYSPLIHIAKHGKAVLNVKLGAKDDPRAPYHPDLVINYSFGHHNSSVLLTPYGAMVNYINHSPDPKKINVKVRWPDKELVAHKPDWLDKDIESLRRTIEKIGLSFEYVATKDIAAGEEVFMDYGKEWEAAWDEHVKNWKPPAKSVDEYVHSSAWKEKFLRTESELKKAPYPDNLHTMCVESYVQSDDSHEFVMPMYPSGDRVECTVLERHKDEGAEEKYIYTVKLHTPDEDVTVHSVPEGPGVRLYDKIFSGDWTQTNTFRFPIQIPDDIMPESWLNGPEPEDSVNVGF